VRLVVWCALLAIVLVASVLPAIGTDSARESARRSGVQAREHGRYAEAERLLSAALAAVAAGPPDERLVESLIDLAILYGRLHRYAEAEPLVRRAGELEEKLRGPQHPALADILSRHAVVLRALGRQAELTDVETRLRASLARPSVRGPSMRWEKAGVTNEGLDADERACARQAEYGATPYGPLIEPDGFTRCIEQRGWHRPSGLIGAGPRSE